MLNACLTSTFATVPSRILIVTIRHLLGIAPQDQSGPAVSSFRCVCFELMVLKLCHNRLHQLDEFKLLNVGKDR